MKLGMSIMAVSPPLLIIVLTFPTFNNNNNMADAQTCELGSRINPNKHVCLAMREAHRHHVYLTEA
jgi:hypothetical protein